MFRQFKNIFPTCNPIILNEAKRFQHFNRITCVRPIPAICSEGNQGFPECAKPNERYRILKKLKLEEEERKKIEARNLFISMWENPQCCKKKCAKLPIRHDAIYWRISDKKNRNYQRTWAECLSTKVPHVKCCFDDPCFLEVEKRDLRNRPKTACEFQEMCPYAPDQCPKVSMPGCKKVRSPLRCFKIRSPSKCCKVCTPYPAYSECLSLKRPPGRPVECDCTCKTRISMCDVYKLLEQGILKLARGPGRRTAI